MWVSNVVQSVPIFTYYPSSAAELSEISLTIVNRFWPVIETMIWAPCGICLPWAPPLMVWAVECKGAWNLLWRLENLHLKILNWSQPQSLFHHIRRQALGIEMKHPSGGHYSDYHRPIAIGGPAAAVKDLLKKNKLGIMSFACTTL